MWQSSCLAGGKAALGRLLIFSRLAMPRYLIDRVKVSAACCLVFSQLSNAAGEGGGEDKGLHRKY